MKMIDILRKGVSKREAVAEGVVYLKPEVMKLIVNRQIPKGDCLGAAKLAGILGAKRTPDLIPLCHPISIESVKIDFTLKDREIIITATAKGEAKTGFEMEALTAVSLAALTIYDMCKPLDKGIVISEIKLLKKSGGKSGRYIRK